MTVEVVSSTMVAKYHALRGRQPRLMDKAPKAYEVRKRVSSQ